MFIQCFDNELKNKLINEGYKLVKENQNYSLFIYDNSNKLNFDGIDKSKFVLTSKMTF